MASFDDAFGSHAVHGPETGHLRGGDPSRVRFRRNGPRDWMLRARFERGRDGKAAIGVETGQCVHPAQSQLAARLRQLYVEGDVDPLAVLLGAQSLDEMVSALDGLNRLATQDKEIVSQLARAKTALRAASARLAARETELEGLLEDARSTRAAVAAARNAKASYLAGLRHQQELNQAQISKLTAQATAASEQSNELSDNTGGTAVPPPPPANGSKMTVSSTGYCLKGSTATGVPTGPGVVAVDPSVIPLGTHMYVPGYGEGVAADTGSAVKGQTIDVWFESCADALAWGRKTVTITLH